MTRASQDAAIKFLTDPANISGSGSVEVVRTHAALVFLSGDTALKIKRAVRYDYLDFSTLEKRHAMLSRELELNSPAAPSIYRDVVPLTKDAAGQLRLNGRGEIVEWVLRMHRFPARDELWHIADRGALTDDLAVKMGTSIFGYHAGAGMRQAVDGAGLIAEILDELNTAFATMTDVLGTNEALQFRTDSERAFQDATPLLRARAQAGHVRRCHGDLHLRNIVLLDGVPTPFDALEFDETLGTCDVLYDLAFLVMDLKHRKLHRAANLVLNSYLFKANSADHEAGLALMPLFLSIRAAIRAMVDVQIARVNPTDRGAPGDARRYMAEALAYLAPVPVWLVAIGGLSGTGKTTLATALAPEIGAAPGAVHLRSDLERKALFGVDPLIRLPAEAYSHEISAKIYTRLAEKAARLLGAGHSVILDAVHLAESERALPAEIAAKANARFAGLWLEADTEVLLNRVALRHNDASDADAAVIEQQAARPTGAIHWTRIAAADDQKTTLSRAKAVLEKSGRLCTAG